MNQYRLTATVKAKNGFCPIYNLGDRIIIEKFYVNSKESAMLCIHAFSAMLTLTSALIHGCSARELGIGMTEDVGYVQCPDPSPPYTCGGTIIFELRREHTES